MAAARLLTPYPPFHERTAIFCILRSVLAGTTAFWETRLLMSLSEPIPFQQSLSRQTQLSEPAMATATVLLLVSTGMTHAAGALLPSSTTMLLWLVCATFYTQRQSRLFCATAVVATLALGWPFGVVVFLPMAIHTLLTHPTPVRLVLVETLLWTCFVQAVVMVTDYSQYGQWTSATYNIFQYNARGGGDELYGVEPWSYYAKNLLLNWNYVGVLGLAFWPVSVLLRVLGKPLGTPLVVLVLSMYPWLCLVGPRPHKEERFLFPMYPALLLGAVVVVESTWRLVGALVQALGRPWFVRPYWILLLVPSVLLSLSRTVALHKYYAAPLQIYNAIPPDTNGTVCTCGEWHRFPSSYYLPNQSRLGFLPSSFAGQLPRPFDQEGSRAGTNFNDQNKPEADRYVAVDECDWVIELETSDDADCLVQMRESSRHAWTKVHEVPFLHAEKTSSTLHRTLYIPYLHEQSSAVHYVSYSLFQKQATNH